MDRSMHIRDLMEGFYALQQKMLTKLRPLVGISHVTFSQWRVLEVLDRQGRSSIKEIHTKLGFSSSAATQLVNELERKKYVYRAVDPTDARVTAIILAPKIKNLLKKLKEQNLKKTIELFKALNDKEFEQYIDLHKKIIKSI